MKAPYKKNKKPYIKDGLRDGLDAADVYIDNVLNISKHDTYYIEHRISVITTSKEYNSLV